MSRRSHSPESSSRPLKRQKTDHLSLEDYKNGVFLAPMVRSGALPTRLFALKYGATMVWGPEIVDKAMLHAKREVDPTTGVISYNGVSRAIFTTHPIEKRYLIYQIGSADPELAVKAAKVVVNDVSGIDLNCGCPKPFSTHAGMGAALLTNPDVLCAILVALRKALPPEITVSAKIRLLPSQEDTLKLVERICETGISALTVHCRTRNMRDRDRAMIERLREIVEFVEGLGKGIAVVENGDCLGWEDAKRVREVTGAHSVMVARGAETNPTCFSATPLVDLDKTLLPAYLRLSKYLDHNWGLTKFCIAQFKGERVTVKKHEATDLRQMLSKAKGFDGVKEVVGEWTGEDEMREIIEAIEKNPPRLRRMYISTAAVAKASVKPSSTNGNGVVASAIPLSNLTTEDEAYATPQNTQNPEPPSSGAPFLPKEFQSIEPLPPKADPVTPTPVIPV
ncbi:tRNA-dihydrouridine synthase 2 [Leucoagaricus gongylophorus]